MPASAARQRDVSNATAGAPVGRHGVHPYFESSARENDRPKARGGVRSSDGNGPSAPHGLVGEYTVGTELHQSETFAIVQVLVLYQLVTAKARVALGGDGARNGPVGADVVAS